MVKLKARAVDNSMGLTLPREVTDRLKIRTDDTVYLTEAPDGNRLTPYNPEFEKQMTIAESVMRRYKDALRQLAK
jgi:putative addiction module antidote